MIYVEKINETYFRILAEPHIRQEIYEEFTITVPNAKYLYVGKSRGKWDGKVRLYNKRYNTLYVGLYRHLIEFAKRRNYNITFSSNCVGLLNSFSLVEGKEYLDSLNLCSNGKPIQFRDYQVVGFTKAIRYKRLLILSPTASGKSALIYAISRYLLDKDCKRGLILVPNVSLVEQLYKDFEDYSNNTWDVEKNCYRIYGYGGVDVYNNKPIIISTWQSLYKLDPTYFHKFDFVIGDEAHLYHANSLKTIMSNVKNASYRIATTGTLQDTKAHNLSIQGLFGPVSKLTTTKQLMDKGYVSELTIKNITLKHPSKYCKLRPYRDEIEFLCGNIKRNDFIKNLALSLKGNTLVLYQYVKMHGSILYDIINTKISDMKIDRKIYFVHGNVDVDDREFIRSIVEKEKDAIIVASYGTFSTGINIKNLHNVIFASPSKSKIRVLQSIGRSLRLGDNKDSATLYDISDILHSGKTPNVTYSHYLERRKIYEEEEFKVSNYTVEVQYE